MTKYKNCYINSSYYYDFNDNYFYSTEIIQDTKEITQIVSETKEKTISIPDTKKNTQIAPETREYLYCIRYKRE